MVLGPKLRLVLPYINFAIGSSALAFQMMVLYPWHHQLDQDFQILKDDQNEKLQKYHQVKLQALTKIEDDVIELKRQQQLHHQVKLQTLAKIENDVIQLQKQQQVIHRDSTEKKSL